MQEVREQGGYIHWIVMREKTRRSSMKEKRTAMKCSRPTLILKMKINCDRSCANLHQYSIRSVSEFLSWPICTLPT